jgi:hypothetical protein
MVRFHEGLAYGLRSLPLEEVKNQRVRIPVDGEEIRSVVTVAVESKTRATGRRWLGAICDRCDTEDALIPLGGVVEILTIDVDMGHSDGARAFDELDTSSVRVVAAKELDRLIGKYRDFDRGAPGRYSCGDELGMKRIEIFGGEANSHET